MGTLKQTLTENRSADPVQLALEACSGRVRGKSISLAISLGSATTRCYLRGILAPQSCGNRWVMNTGLEYPFKPGGFVHHALL